MQRSSIRSPALHQHPEDPPPRSGLLRKTGATLRKTPDWPAVSTALETGATPTWRNWKYARWTGGPEASQVQGATTQNTHRSPEGSVGECAACEVQGTLTEGDGQRVGHPQKHSPHVRLGRKPFNNKEKEKRSRDTVTRDRSTRLTGHFRHTLTEGQFLTTVSIRPKRPT